MALTTAGGMLLVVADALKLYKPRVFAAVLAAQKVDPPIAGLLGRIWPTAELAVGLAVVPDAIGLRLLPHLLVPFVYGVELGIAVAMAAYLASLAPSIAWNAVWLLQP